MSTLSAALAPTSSQIHHVVRCDPLRNLIHSNLQSARRLREAASSVTDAVLRQRLLGFVAQHLSNAAELEDTLVAHGDNLGFARRFATAAQRWWTAFRPHGVHGDAHAVLDHAARSEHAIDRTYQRAMRAPADGTLASLLERQYEDLRRAYAVIGDLRDLMEE